MGDIFNEQLVKRKPTRKDALIKAGLIAAALVIVYAVLLLIPSLLPVAAIVLGFGIFYVFNMLKKEYEYIFTNGGLDIDCIYGKARRKRKFTCDVKDAILMAHSSRKDALHELSTASSAFDYSSGNNLENAWHLLAVQGGKRVKITFEPNETMLKAILTYISPRKLYKKQ